MHQILDIKHRLTQKIITNSTQKITRASRATENQCNWSSLKQKFQSLKSSPSCSTQIRLPSKKQARNWEGPLRTWWIRFISLRRLSSASATLGTRLTRADQTCYKNYRFPSSAQISLESFRAWETPIVIRWTLLKTFKTIGSRRNPSRTRRIRQSITSKVLKSMGKGTYNRSCRIRRKFKGIRSMPKTRCKSKSKRVCKDPPIAWVGRDSPTWWSRI